MRSLTIDDALALSGSGAGTAFDLAERDHPFVPNNNAIVCLSSADASSAAFKLEGSTDGGTTWADLDDVDGNTVELSAAGVQFFNVVLPEQIRTNITDDGTGTAQVALIGN